MSKRGDSKRLPARNIGLIGLLLTILLWAAATYCYQLRPDCCAAVTVWPPWVWVVPGLGLLAIGSKGRSKKVSLIVLGMWLFYLLVFCEEPRSVVLGPVRHWFVSRSYRGRTVRVVSLNCAAGSLEAAEEVCAYHPDIVLLQESPSRSEVKALARKLFGREAGFTWGIDGSVVARGPVDLIPLSRELAIVATQARVRISPNVEIKVMSIRLAPPIVRADVWSPEHWREQAALRREHRRKLRLIAEHVARGGRHDLAIVGGDMNAPARDGALRELMPYMHDTFGEAGTGWGNTVLNDIPVLRFDQVWASRRWNVLAVRAHKTQHSDHRIVVCDLALSAAGK